MHNPSHVYSKITPMLDIVYEHSLDQIVTSPSRYASFLDLVFCTKFMVHDNVSYSRPIGNSDHCCQSFNIFTDQLICAEPGCSEYYLDFENADYEQFGSWLNCINWCVLFSDSRDVNDLWCKFLYVLDQGRDLFIPKRKKKF
jgi:hypothetical protein